MSFFFNFRPQVFPRSGADRLRSLSSACSAARKWIRRSRRPRKKNERESWSKKPIFWDHFPEKMDHFSLFCRACRTEIELWAQNVAQLANFWRRRDKKARNDAKSRIWQQYGAHSRCRARPRSYSGGQPVCPSSIAWVWAPIVCQIRDLAHFSSKNGYRARSFFISIARLNLFCQALVSRARLSQNTWAGLGRRTQARCPLKFWL